jgi:hypothetical protein
MLGLGVVAVFDMARSFVACGGKACTTVISALRAHEQRPIGTFLLPWVRATLLHRR